MNQNLKIGTINVRGLADETKRKQLFKTWECKYNILFLNETHCDNSKEKNGQTKQTMTQFGLIKRITLEVVQFYQI